MQDELSGLPTFLAIARGGSFRAASDALRVTPSAVSQTLRALEERLGLRLFTRTTRSVALTEAGEHLLRRLEPAFADVRGALESLQELRSRPAGLLRLNVSSIAESFLSTSLLPDFLAEYPDIRLDLAVDDSESDIVSEGFDAGVRLGEVIAQDMVAVPVSKPQRQVVVGSPAYLAAHGRPRHPRDLHEHACIGWRLYSRPAPYRWEFTERGKEIELAIQARVDTNDMGVMLRLALAGVGLSGGLEETFRPYLQRGELVSVLDRYCLPFPGFYLYYPSRALRPPKLTALVEFLRARSSRRR